MINIALKKIIFVTLVVSLLFALSACSDSKDKSKPEKSKQNTKEQNTKASDNKNTDDETTEPPTATRGMTTLRNGVTVVKVIQTMEGTQDFSSVTLEKLQDEDPDIEFSASPLGPNSAPNAVAVLVLEPTRVILQSRNTNSGECFFVELNSEDNTRYGASVVGETETCPIEPGIGGGNPFAASTDQGWALPAG